MAKNSFLVAADLAFFPALNALLNSLDYIGYNDVINIILFKDTPLDYLDHIQNKVGYEIKKIPFREDIYRDTFGGMKTDYMKRYRYYIASQICYDYNAICFLDVDMFFVRNVDIFFEIASRGIMLGCAKTGKTRYGVNPSYYIDGKDPLPNSIWNDKDICCCPIFFNHAFHNVFHYVWYGYTTELGRMKASDLFAINQSVLVNDSKYSSYSRLITMPCQSWVGTNEVMLKPYTRVVEKEGQLISENGDLVYSVHGKWFSEGWHNGQRLHMDRLIDSQLGGSQHWKNQYKTSMNHIFKWFLKMAIGYKVSALDYSQYLKKDALEFLQRAI